MLSSKAPNAAPTFYDVQAVAGMFRMSRMTVYRAIRSGELPAVRIRGRWLVPARVIDALVTAAEAAVQTRPLSDRPVGVSPLRGHANRPQESASVTPRCGSELDELPAVDGDFSNSLSAQQLGGEING
jgi:excisionase family DNA binding protein